MLFGNKKTTESCCCSCNSDSKSTPCNCDDASKTTENASILILGSGCKNCQILEENTKAALAILGKDSPVGHITDFTQIASYGVMTTPALVVDGKVISSGKVLKPEEIVNLLKATWE